MTNRTRRTRFGAAVAALSLALGAVLAEPARPAAPAPGARAVVDPLEASLAERRARVEREPSSPQAWVALGDLLELLGRTEEAEAAYRRLLELDAPAGHYHLGRLFAGAGHRFAARRELARALDLDPAHAAAHYELGALYDDWDLDRLARRHFTRAFALDPSLGDPAVNPLVGESRQALAALVAGWGREPALGARPAAAAAATPRPLVPDSPEPRSDAEPAAAGSTGGGFARSTGGGAAGGSRATVGEGGAPIELDSRSLRAGGASRGRGAEDEPASEERVLSSGSLDRGGSVNQVVPQGGTGMRGSRGSRRPPIYSPPVPMPEPPEGFEPSPESTGRIERGLAPAGPGYALGAERS